MRSGIGAAGSWGLPHHPTMTNVMVLPGEGGLEMQPKAPKSIFPDFPVRFSRKTGLLLLSLPIFPSEPDNSLALHDVWNGEPGRLLDAIRALLNARIRFPEFRVRFRLSRGLNLLSVIPLGDTGQRD